jgi:predicted nuclease with RNAse H fold
MPKDRCDAVACAQCIKVWDLGSSSKNAAISGRAGLPVAHPVAWCLLGMDA